jgi:hypothetical protein
VALALELTFARRDIFESFRALFNAPEPFFFFESPEAITRLLSLIRPLPINLIADGGVFVLQAVKNGQPVLYREKFLWAFDAILYSIEEAYAVSRPAAEDMYRAFVSRDLSPTAERHIGGIVAPFVETFLTATRKAKLRGATFCLTPHPMPFPLPHREAAATIEEIPFRAILGKFDITIVPGSLAARPDLLLRHLAPFLLMYFEGTQGALNERLRKKVHWLTG